MSPSSHTDDPQAASHGRAVELALGGLRGVVAAMAMSGMRKFTGGLGIVREEPPRAIIRKQTKGLFRLAPRGKRRAVTEIMHWGYGAVGGVGFAALPDGVRRRPWAGPAYGLVLWLSFSAGIAPALGLKHSKRPKATEQAALIADHLLYGIVLSDMGGGSGD